jgi:hypothetical protein
LTRLCDFDFIGSETLSVVVTDHPDTFYVWECASRERLRGGEHEQQSTAAVADHESSAMEAGIHSGAARQRPDMITTQRSRLRVLVGLALLIAAGAPLADGAVPSTPTNLHVPFVTRFEIAVAWTASPGATVYQLEYRETASGPNGAFSSYGPGAVFDETSMRLGSLNENTAYDLRVYAGNASGWSAASELVGDSNVKTTDPPDPPMDVREYAFTETSLSLTWNDAAGAVATHWRVKVSGCEKKVWQVPCVEGRPCLADRTVRCTDYQYYKENGAVVEFTSKPVIIRNLQQGNTYFMIVEARNRNINGYYYGGSLPVRLVPRGPYDSAPTNLRVNGVHRDAVLLSWEAAPGATHYRVQYRIPAESASWLPTSNMEQLLTTSTVYAVLGLTQDKTYEFRVLARDLFESTIGGGQVVWAGDVQGYEEDQFASNIVSATPVQQLHDPPTGLTVVGVRDTEVHLKWDFLPRADYYVLQYKKLDEPYEHLEFWKDVEANLGESLRLSGNTGVVTELTTGRRYQFRVKAFNAHIATATYPGYSGPSSSVYAIPLARPAPSQDFGLILNPWLDFLQCAHKPCLLRASQTGSVQLGVDAPDQDGVLVGALLRITSGGAIHENSHIIAYNGTSKNATLASPFAKLPSAGDGYEMSRYPIGVDRGTVTWTHSPGATKYRISIRRSGAHEKYMTKVVLSEPMDESAACMRAIPNNGSSHPSLGLVATRCFEITGLQKGVTYDVILNAGNLHLEWGLDSQVVHITPISPPSETPGSPMVLSQTAESVMLKWSTPIVSSAPTTVYRIQFRKVTADNSAAWSLPRDYHLLTDSDSGFEVTGMMRGFAHDFEVVAGNLAGFRYPAMSFRLVMPCTDVRINAVRSVEDCSRSSRSDCLYMSVHMSWTASEDGNFFKVVARKRGSASAYVGLPTVAQPPYISKATILNVTSFVFDNLHYPDLQENAEFEYKVISSFSADGPFEDVGSVVVVAVSSTTPSPVHTLRLKSKTMHSITVKWNHSETDPKPYFFVARLCPAAGTVLDVPGQNGVIAFEDKAAQSATIAIGGGITNEESSLTLVLDSVIPNLDVGEYVKTVENEYLKVVGLSTDKLTLTIERDGEPSGLTKKGSRQAASGGEVVILVEGGVDDNPASQTVKLVQAIPGLDVDEYIKSDNGEYMKVTAIVDSGKTLTVERDAAPPGLVQASISAAAAGTSIILVQEESEAGRCSGKSLYPNNRDMSKATRFTEYEATLDLFSGVELSTDLPYNITIYACNYFDADSDGVLTGNEGCNANGVQLPYSVMPGGLATQVSTVSIIETSSNIVKLQWQRSGALGNAATMYAIYQREMGTLEWTVAKRIIVRGKFGNCANPDPTDPASLCARCSASQFETQDFDVCLKAMGVTYGTAQGADTCGMDFCVENFAGSEMFISEGVQMGQVRTLRHAPIKATGPQNNGNVFFLNQTLFGVGASDAWSVEFTSSTYNVYRQEQLGGLCCPVMSQKVDAYIGDLKSDTAYQFQVFSGTMNEHQFETSGSQIATGFTISKANGVRDLTFVYLVKANGTKVTWTDPGGPKFCGERVYQILARVDEQDQWEVLNVTTPQDPWIKHTNYVNGLGIVDLNVIGLPWARTLFTGITYAPAVLKNYFMVRTYCSNHLGLSSGASIPGISYLDGIALSRVDGNIIDVTLKPPPSAVVTGLKVVFVTENSAYLKWNTLDRAEFYKVLVSHDSMRTAGPWITGFEAFSDWKDWKNKNNETQIFRNPEAYITGLTTNLRYRFKIMAGTRHEHIVGTFSAQSLPIHVAYTTSHAPTDSDIDLSLYKITATSIKVRFSVALQKSVDPSNHTTPVVSLLLKKGSLNFEGGLNASGCSTEVAVENTYIGPPPGCVEFTRFNYTAEGRSFYEYNFQGLQEGVAHQVMVKTFNLNAPSRRQIVYSGNATSCICEEYASYDQCIRYRIFGSTLSCDHNLNFAYMQPPASGNDNAYKLLYAFVRTGTGAGQQRRISQYNGTLRRMDVDSPWDIFLDETSVVEIHESGLSSEGIIVQGCTSGSQSCAFLNLEQAKSSTVWDAYKDHYLELIGGACDKQARRVVGYDGDAHQAVVYPPFTCNPEAGVQMYEIRAFSSATKSIGPIEQCGPPMRPSMPIAVDIKHNSVELSWDEIADCISSSGNKVKCQVESYRIRKKKTHDSSDFPIINSTWSSDFFYSSKAGTIMTGFEDMCSFEVQISAKTAHNDEWGLWSPSQYFKLTGGAPSLQPRLLPFPEGRYNDRILVQWMTDLNPKQIDRFYFAFGESQTFLQDFTTEIDGQQVRKVFMDNEVCTQISSTKASCEAYLTGLEKGTIYFVKVFGGNMNGFEEKGTETGSQATLRLPVSPVTQFTMEGVILSGNVSGFGVRLAWKRPQAFPAVTRYYVAGSENGGQFARLQPTIHSTDRNVEHTVSDLNKGSTYRFRVHCGNEDGPTGFHVDMDEDPTVSEIITVIPDGAPGRSRIAFATPVVPDMNSMAELQWEVPNAGAEASYYNIGMKLIYDLSGCDRCDRFNPDGSPRDPYVGFCLATNEEAPIYNVQTNTWRYRKCANNPPCDATCDATLGISLYTGCTNTDPGCATNPACNPVKRLCLQPCMGAKNEGPGSAGKACIFENTNGLVTGLTRNSWYEFYVYAGNTGALGIASNPLWMKTASLPVPVTGLNISMVTVDKVRLVWNVMDPALCTGNAGPGQYKGNCTYKVTWDPPTSDGSMAYVQPKVGSDGMKHYESSYDHRVDFSRGSIRYVYRVYAGDDFTNLYEQFGTDITLPAGATEFKVTAATENSLTFSWIPDPAANTFQILMSSGLAYRAASAETGSTRMRVEGLAPDLQYNFKVVSKVYGRTPFEYSGSNVYRAVPTGLPVEPKNLDVVSTSQSSVVLTWKPGSEQQAVRYQIVRSLDGSPYAFPQDIEMLQGGSHVAHITDLSDFSMYKFKVYAGNFKGFETKGSNEVKNVQPVGRARELSIRGVSDTSVTIDWLPPEHGRSPSNYQLQYTIGDVTTRIADVQHLGGNRATQSALLTPLYRDIYKLRIFSKSHAGYYEPSGTGDVIAVPMVVPYKLRTVFTNFDSVTLAWEIPPQSENGFQPVSFRIEYVLTSDGTTGTVQNIPVYLNRTTVTGLTTNRPYTFSIKASFQEDMYFGTLASNLVSATPFDQPSNLTITAVSGTTVSLSWFAPARGVLPIGYRVRFFDIETGTFKDVNDVPHAGSFGAKQSYTVSGLSNGRQVGFIVLAQAGTGAYSDNEIEPIKTTPLILPDNLRATSVTHTSARVEWSPPQAQAGSVNPQNYELHFKDKIDIIPFGSSHWLVNDLLGGDEYTFCLYVRSRTGDLVAGNGGCISVIPVNQVKNLRPIDVSSTTITLQWASVKPVPSDNTKYVISAVPVERAFSGLLGQESWQPVVGKVFVLL